MEARGTSTWLALGGSVQGSSHVAGGLPNEDAWAASDPGPVTAIAVADGHGAARSPRAGWGARFAVEVAVAALVDAAVGAPSPTTLEPLLRERTGPSIVARWREEALADAAARPFEADELLAIGSPVPSQAQVLRAYGCTLLGLCGSPGALAIVQIGDGDTVCVRADGEYVFRPLPEDPHNVGNVTTSLCLPAAEQHLRAVVIDLVQDPLLLAFASTDGFGGAYTERDWWQQVGVDLAERARSLSTDELAERIPQWLAEPARVGGDDATIAVLLAPAGKPGSG